MILSFRWGPAFASMEDTEEQVKVHEMAKGKSIRGTCTLGLTLKTELCGHKGSAANDTTYAMGPQLASFVAEELIDENMAEVLEE